MAVFSKLFILQLLKQVYRDIIISAKKTYSNSCKINILLNAANVYK